MSLASSVYGTTSSGATPRARAHRHVVGQVVAVPVREVREAAALDDEPPRVRAVAARVPAVGSASGQARDRVDRKRHVLALDVLVDLLVGNPAPAVARDLVAVGQERVDDRRIARQRHRHAENGQRHPALAEEPQDPPHAGARAVLVQRLHRHVPGGKGLRGDDLGQEGLRRGVPVQHAVLGAFLVVEHELHGHPGAARPVRVRRRRAVAGEVARITGFERPMGG